MRTVFILLSLVISFTSSAQRNIDVKIYHFEIEVSDQSDAITGLAIIEVQFLADASQIQFDLASLEDDKGMIAFQVKESGSASILKHTHSNDKLLITLDKPAREGEIRSFQIEYMGIPKDGLIISKNKYGDRTFFADNWPNRAHQWIPCVDQPDDKAAFEFFVKAPSHYQVISNGIKINETKLDQNKTLTYWRNVQALSTKMMVIGVARFATRVFGDSPDSIPVSAWVYPQDSVKGFYDYGLAPGILKFFSNYIAPYPFKKLANVQSKTIFGGMENASAIFYAEESVTGTRKCEDVIAHEIAHQWFGDMVSEKSFAHLWLSEGFATYLTDIYFEKTYGKTISDQRLKEEREQVVEFAKKSDRAVVDSVSELMSLLNANSYQKGAWVLHMLRNEVGDEVFQKIIKLYYEMYEGRNAESKDFQVVAEFVCMKRMNWFFDQWLYRPGIPVLEIQKKIDEDGVKIRIIQGKDIYRFNLEIGVKTEGKEIIQSIPVNGRETEFKLKMKGVKDVVIDPGTKLLFSEMKIK